MSYGELHIVMFEANQLVDQRPIGLEANQLVDQRPIGHHPTDPDEGAYLYIPLRNINLKYIPLFESSLSGP